jgi:hypothetical protein
VLGDPLEVSLGVARVRRGQALARQDRARPVAERERGLGAADVDAEQERDGVSPRAT